MPRVTYIQPDGSRESAEVRSGASVMLGAIAGNISGIEAECGGALDCATCHVYVDAAWLARLSPPTEAEEALLEGVAAERRLESRLSCQIAVSPDLDGLAVHVPARQS